MTPDAHDRCRRCGSPDGPSHTATACERVMAQRREAQAAHDRGVSPTGVLCGHGVLCEWMRAALSASNTTGAAFIRREMDHPDTLRPVVRYLVALEGVPTRVVRACPACGGNPNAEAMQPR